MQAASRRRSKSTGTVSRKPQSRQTASDFYSPQSGSEGDTDVEESAKSARFAQITNEDDVEMLVEERNCLSTKSQTRWAVRVLRGEFTHKFDNVLFLHVS